MQVICSGCNAKINVPDKAAGKRIKCPRCANPIVVPAADGADPEAPGGKAGVSSGPPPKSASPKPPADESADDADESEAEGGVTEKPSSSGKKPPPIKPQRAAKDDDEEEDEEEEPTPPKKRRNDDDDDDDDAKSSNKGRDDDDEDDDKPRKKRGRDDDDDEDDDVDVRKKKRGKKPAASGLAMTSMILGITGLVIAVPGCCCCGLFHILAFICGLAAVIMGFMSKSTPGSEGMAMTGIITGFIGLAMGLVAVVIFILSMFFNIGMAGLDMGMGGNRWQMHNPPPHHRFR